MAGAETLVEVGHNRLSCAGSQLRCSKRRRGFVNQDPMPEGHTIVADDGTFSSPPLGPDESWSHTFTEVGDHGYSIQQHPSATGTVTVE